MTVVDIFSNECDSRDADEVLLARMRQLSDPHTAQFKSFVQLILSIIKAKIQFTYEGCRQGGGIDDDELYDVALWLKECVFIEQTNRDLIEMFRMEILQRVARDAAAAALLPPKPVKLKPVKLKPVKEKRAKMPRAKKLVDFAQGQVA